MLFKNISKTQLCLLTPTKQIPCILVVISLFIFQIIYSVLRSFYDNRQITAIFFGYQLGLWIILCFGFIIYGRRLVTLMPPQITKQIRSVCYVSSSSSSSLVVD